MGDEQLVEAMAERLERRLPTSGSGIPMKLARDRRLYHRIVLEELSSALRRSS